MPVVARHRPRVAAAELEAVVARRVVAGRHLHAAGGAQVPDREVAHRRGDQADRAPRRGRLRAGPRPARARAARSRAACRARPRWSCRRRGRSRSSTTGNARPIALRHRLVDLGRVDAADVVGLEDSCHVTPSRSRARTRVLRPRRFRSRRCRSSRGGELDRQRLAGDPLAVAVDRLLELGVRPIADADAIGVVEVALLAQALDAVDDLARETLVDQVRRELGVERDQQLAVALDRHAGALDQPHLDLFGRRASTRSPSSSIETAPLVFELLRQRVAVGGGERGLDRRHALAEARPQLGEDRQHVVVDVLGAPLGESDLAHVELVAHQIEVGVDPGGERAVRATTVTLWSGWRVRRPCALRAAWPNRTMRCTSAHALFERRLVAAGRRLGPVLEVDARRARRRRGFAPGCGGARRRRTA